LFILLWRYLAELGLSGREAVYSRFYDRSCWLCSSWQNDWSAKAEQEVSGGEN